MKTILLVEDRPEDVFLLNRALERAAFSCNLQVATNGQKIIEYLSGSGVYADRKSYPLPALVLLDIKMPRPSGHEVVQWIRTQPQFNYLPVVMLTSSNDPSDVERAYNAGANSYLVKPPLYSAFERMLPCVLEYWLNLNHPNFPAPLGKPMPQTLSGRPRKPKTPPTQSPARM
jgi:CheY-like chemotaxis protein